MALLLQDNCRRAGPVFRVLVPFSLFDEWGEGRNWEANSPEQSDAALGGGGHGAVVVDGVLGGDVVLQEQALGVLLLQGVPLAGILWR